MDRFSIHIVIRVLVILAISIVLGMVFMRPDYFFTQVILAILLVLLTMELIHYARRTSRNLARFMLAVKHGDVSVNFSENQLDPAFRSLAGSFRDMIDAYNQVKIRKESQYQLLQAIIDRISFGIIAFNEEDEILLVNQSALDLLGLEPTKDWNYVKRQNLAFVRQIENMAKNGRKLVELERGTILRQFSVYNHELVLLEKHSRVITFYDIQSEIEQKEIEAWYKLIRILTHEIMNSTTPILSLTETILMLLEDQRGEQKTLDSITGQNIQDVRSSVNTIKRRSEGILQFVEAYRKLTDIPHPELKPVAVGDMISSSVSLLRAEYERRGIPVHVEVEPVDLVAYCDRNLMEQVLINLLTNSMYALEGRTQPKVEIRAFANKGRVSMLVSDNGKGMDKSLLQKIFIPFFSTRDGGSGIGLSFSKFVIHQHKGTIQVDSRKNEGAKFIIELPIP